MAGTTGVYGNTNNLLSVPQSIYVDFDKNLYITDYNHRVIKWAFNATSGIVVAGNGTMGSAANQLAFPYDAVVDNNNNVIICDGVNYRIQKWNFNSNVGTTIYTSGINYPSSAEGIFLTKNGDLYVVDNDLHRILKYQNGSTAPIVVAGGSFGSGNTQLKFPVSVFVDNYDNLYVSDQGNHRIQKFPPNSSIGVTVAGVTGERGILGEPNKLYYPRGIHVDSDGNLYIVDSSNSRVQKWSPNATSGVTVAGISGERGSDDFHLNNPSDVFVDAEGNIYVADTDNQRIQKYKVDCQSNLSLSTNISNEKIIRANIGIIATNKIDTNGNKVKIEAAKIDLIEGFEIKSGSIVQINPGSCSN